MLSTLWALVFISVASATLTNVTSDDASGMVTYVGDWGAPVSSLDFQGSHKLCSDPNASATFKFTGVAVYYLSTLWPYAVNTILMLDDDEYVFLNLTDPLATPTDGGSASASFDVRWARTGLSNTTHELKVTMATDQGGIYIVLDGFIYTMDDGIDASTTTTTKTPSPSNRTNMTIIAIVAAIGALTLLVAAALAIFFWRRHKSSQLDIRDEQFSNIFPNPAPPIADVPIFRGMLVHPTHSRVASSNSNTITSNSSTAHLMRHQRSYSINTSDFSSEFDPYVCTSIVGLSTTTRTNFAGLGAAGLGAGGSDIPILHPNPAPVSVAAASSSKGGLRVMNGYADEKRAQSLALRRPEQSFPPPAYTRA